MNKTPTASDIREKYPNPIRLGDEGSAPEDCGYCVGGALVRYMFLSMPSETAINFPWNRSCFPSPHAIQEALLTANPHLSLSHAKMSAEIIIHKNDSGNIEGAWDALDRTLSYTSPGHTDKEEAQQ